MKKMILPCLLAAGLLAVPALASEGQGPQQPVPVTIVLRNGNMVSGTIDAIHPVHVQLDGRYQPLALRDDDLNTPMLINLEQLNLLERFPPNANWSGRRREELIQKQKNNLALTRDEATFLRQFDDWEEALRYTRYQSLLDLFSPDNWNEGTRVELLERRHEKREQLNEEEQVFLANYEEWYQAVQVYRNMRDHAGFRVWNVNNTPGFMFISYNRIVGEVRPGSRLNAQQVRDLQARVEESVRVALGDDEAANAELQRFWEGQREKRLAKRNAGGGGGGGDEERIILANPQWQALIERYPPEKGWSPQRLSEIYDKIDRGGTTITPEEWQFLDVYNTWEPAYNEYMRLKDEMEERRRREEEEAARRAEEPEPTPPAGPGPGASPAPAATGTPAATPN